MIYGEVCSTPCNCLRTSRMNLQSVFYCSDKKDCVWRLNDLGSVLIMGRFMKWALPYLRALERPLTG